MIANCGKFLLSVLGVLGAFPLKQLNVVGAQETNFVCESSAFNAAHYALPASFESETTSAGLPPQLKHVFGTFVGMSAWIPGLKEYETPLVVRFTHLIDRIDWNCAASYSSNWKDYLTRADPLVRAPKTIMWEFESINLHNSDLRLQCMAHAWATIAEDWVPESASDVFNHFINFFGFTDVTAGYSLEVSTCFNDGNADTTCLNQLAENNCYKPSIMGAIVAHQVAEFGRTDGWNMYGDLNRDGTTCTANCRRYTDPTGFKPKIPRTRNPIHWQPLRETNSRGYETKQQHVTAHIGTLAVPSTMTRAQVNAKSSPDPNYNYAEEALLVIDRLKNLNDETKLEIEFFNDKLDVVMTIVDKIVQSGASFEQVLNYAVGMTGAEYDAIIVAWKEKVHHDRIRPTSWIQTQMVDQTIDAWVPNEGVKPILAQNFEAFVRVMPHSEYVSGSACICQALADYTDDWLSSNLGIENSISVSTPQWPAGTSQIEPGIVPAGAVQLTYENMQALKSACGESRLHGGMHFSASVTEGYELCAGIGNGAAVVANDLWSV